MSDVQELKLQVADVLKSLVKGAAWAIDKGTEVAYGFAPDNMDRGTVRYYRCFKPSKWVEDRTSYGAQSVTWIYDLF